MGIRYRKMREQDIDQCLKFLESQPHISSRYPRLTDVGECWSRMIRDESSVLILYEEYSEAQSRVWGISTAVFVQDSFMEEMKRPPWVWIGPEVARRVVNGNSPFLTKAQLKAANSTEGVNILVLQGSIRPENSLWVDTYYAGVNAFFEEYRGYRIKEIVGVQADTPSLLKSSLLAGAILLGFTEGLPRAEDEEGWERLISKPHILFISREIARQQEGSWFSSVFQYFPPKLGLSLSQQKLILRALKGGTDRALSEELGISLTGVKRSWASIYERAAPHVEGLRSRDEYAAEEPASRGSEQRRFVIEYVRAHMEEVRPFSPALLRKHLAAG
jgi:hypothetical protein